MAFFHAKTERMLRFAGVIRLMDDASGRTFIPYFSFLFGGKGISDIPVLNEAYRRPFPWDEKRKADGSL